MREKGLPLIDLLGELHEYLLTDFEAFEEILFLKQVVHEVVELTAWHLLMVLEHIKVQL